jgi:hypothetical protein
VTVESDKQKRALKDTVFNIIRTESTNNLMNHSRNEQEYIVIKQAKLNVAIAYNYLLDCLDELQLNEDNRLMYYALRLLITDVQTLGRYAEPTELQYEIEKGVGKLYFEMGKATERVGRARKNGIKRGEQKSRKADLEWRNEFLIYVKGCYEKAKKSSKLPNKLGIARKFMDKEIAGTPVDAKTLGLD